MSGPESRPDPDGRRILAAISLAGFASTLSMRFFDPMIAVVARDFAADPTRVALLSTAFALPYALVQPILGPVGDALGKERVMMICLALLGAALVACAFAPSEPWLFGMRVLSGAAAGGVIPLALATIGDRVAMVDRQIAISQFLLFSISGQLLGGVLAGLLAETIGWRGVTGLAAVMALCGFGGLMFALRGRAPHVGRFALDTALERYGRILSLSRALFLFSFVFVEAILFFSIQPFIAPLLEARSAGGAFEAGLILAAFGLGGVFYTLNVRWLLRTFGVRRMLMLGGVIGACAYGIVATEPAWFVLAGLFFALGAAFYMLHNSYQTQVTELVSDARGSAVSLHAFSFFVGQAVGPVIIGLALNGVGVSATVLLCALGVAGLGFASSVILFPRHPRPL